MNELQDRTILVTGAGGPAGVAVIQALGRAGMRTVGADCDSRSAGLHLAELGVVVPRIDAPGYVDRLLDLALAHGCDGVISTMSEELVLLGPVESRFRSLGLATWFPPAGAVANCIDKWAFAQVMAESNVAAPPTALGEVGEVPGPWVVKPRFGRGSQDVYRTTDRDLLPALLALTPDPIVQRCLTGREFTADCLVDRDGTVCAVVPRWRSETRGGISTKGETFLDPRVDRLVADAVAALGLHGCLNLQGFVDTDGPARIMEINPRFSGALPLSLAAGADLVGQFARGMFGLPLELERLQARPGVSMVRYFADIIATV